MNGHVIHRQVLEIAVPDKVSARGAQDAISNAFNGSWLSILERIFDEEVLYESTVKLDRLVIDLTFKSLPDITSAHAAIFEHQLRSALRESIRKHNMQRVDSEHKPGGTPTTDPASQPQSFITLLEHYLTTGRIQWHGEGIAVIRKELNQRMTLLSKDKVLIQLIINFDKRQWGRFTPLLTAHTVSLLLKRIIGRSNTSFNTIVALSRDMISALEPEYTFPNDKRLIENSIKRSIITSFIKLQTAQGQRESSGHMVTGWIVNILTTNHVPLTVINKVISFMIGEKPGMPQNDILLSIYMADDLVAPLQSEAISSQTHKTFNDGVGLFIPNAGVVLLWPYLVALFKAYGWTQGDEFVDSNSRNTAIQSLAWLSTGAYLEDETSSAMYKIICGQHPDDICDPEVQLPDDIKIECQNLLINVVKNWGALKNTTIDGLRQAFLQRPGILFLDSQGWRIVVESRSIDILLNKLTWPLSIIKLPWNKYLIHIDWQ